MDANGYPDILYYTFIAPYGWGIIYNNGDGTFTDVFIHQSEYTEFLNIDFLNNDNRPDILVSSSNTQPGNYIAYNYDTGFALDTLFDHSELWIYNTIIDIDIDGDYDILFNKPSILNYGKYLIYENLSNENFINKGTTNKKTGTRIDVVSDLDGDDYPDIACISPTSGKFISQRDSVFIFLNTQNWSFKLLDKIYIGENKNYNEHIYSGDLNGDGFPELLVTGYKNPTTSHIRILWNDGTGHFVDSNLVKTNEHLISKLKITAFPNPFSEETTFEFTIKETAHVELSVYNLQGKLVNSLTNKMMKEGKYQKKWNGTDASGNKVNEGIYFYSLIANKKTLSTNKLIFTH